MPDTVTSGHLHMAFTLPAMFLTQISASPVCSPLSNVTFLWTPFLHDKIALTLAPHMPLLLYSLFLLIYLYYIIIYILLLLLVCPPMRITV